MIMYIFNYHLHVYLKLLYLYEEKFIKQIICFKSKYIIYIVDIEHMQQMQKAITDLQHVVQHSTTKDEQNEPEWDEQEYDGSWSLGGGGCGDTIELGSQEEGAVVTPSTWVPRRRRLW